MAKWEESETRWELTCREQRCQLRMCYGQVRADWGVLSRLSTMPAKGTHSRRPSLSLRGLHFAGSALKAASTQSVMASGCGAGMMEWVHVGTRLGSIAWTLTSQLHAKT